MPRILIAIVLCGFALPPSLPAQAARTKVLSEEFKLSTTVNKSTDTSVIIGHAVGSRDTMRVEIVSQRHSLDTASIAPAGKVGIIVTDSGKTITYIDYEKQQFFRVRPKDMIEQAQRMGAMKVDFSDTRATVDSLGSGPVLLGHPTLHYRVTTGMTVNMSAMGQEQVVKVANSGDYYYATDIGGELNPFASLNDADMVTMVGTSNKEFTDKMKSIQARLPKRTPLRAASSSTVEARGDKRVIDSFAEVTSIAWVDSDPKVFEVPSTYTGVKVPGLEGSSNSGGGVIPPK